MQMCSFTDFLCTYYATVQVVLLFLVAEGYIMTKYDVLWKGYIREKFLFNVGGLH
jgi:hypothetical protein